ncbi:MAG: BPSS1780 family membrane protein [Pseudomonadota bacterium]
MSKLPARAGWHWVKQGMQVFRRQPGALMALFFCCMFLSLFSLLIPLIGGMAPILLAPMFSVALLQACADIDDGKRAMPSLVLSGFRKPARRPLLGLGVLYLLVMLLSLTVLSLMDGGVLVQMATRQIEMDQKLLEDSRSALFVSSGVYLAGWMLTCLAAPLIYWQKMTLAKALFFSVVTVCRDIKAFLAVAIVLFLMFQVCTAIPVLLFDSPQLEVASIFTIFLMMIVLMHCTLYASYRQIFGAPPQAEAAAVKLDQQD